MTGQPRSADLLDGPRGRRLRLSILAAENPTLWTTAFHAAGSQKGVTELARAVVAASVSIDPGRPPDAVALLHSLEESTSTAMYWQPADEFDTMLRDEALAAALEPTARRIAESEAAAWWWAPIALDGQRYVRWIDELEMQPPALTGAAGRLSVWRSTMRAGEAASSQRPADVTANHGGSWWSIPALAEIVVTTRALPGLGATRLSIVEDGFSWAEAEVVPLRPRTAPRVYEITGPPDWVGLVARYGLDVTLSRRHDWWKVTGMDVRWTLVDWEAVASDFDAVHLTVAGYLGTAGRALPVGDAFTLLAGWDPDATYWLTDILEATGPAGRWVRDASVDGPWAPAAET